MIDQLLERIAEVAFVVFLFVILLPAVLSL